MNNKTNCRWLGYWLIGIYLALVCGSYNASFGRQGEGRWEKAIRSFEEKDKQALPSKNAVLFVGSSSIRMWDLPKYFPDLEVINRGFGGSQVADSVRYMSRIVTPHVPQTVVLYAGGNDITAGKSPETVFSNFKKFVGSLRWDLPEARLIYICTKPSISRWRLVDKMRRANELIRTYIEKDDRILYADIDTPMLGQDGKPRRDLFIKDGLHLNDKGYKLWTSVVRPLIDASEPNKVGRLLLATCQFPVSADVAANAEWIHKQLRQAHALHADIVHFSECALSGYVGVDHKTLDNFDWAKQRKKLELILSLADELDLWVVLGCVHRLSEGMKPHNSLYLINPGGKIVDRYDKRFCTGGDLRHYSPGDHFVTFNVNGVRCGLLICYDIRFPELYRQYHKLGVQLMFHSFYNARQKEGSIHPKIMPPTAQARAATNYMFLSVNNSCAPHSWESLFVTPDGLIQRKLALDQAGIMINQVDTTKKYYDASRPYRLDCINGKWNSGQTVDDSRSNNHQSY